MLISTSVTLSASETGSVDFIEIQNQAGFAKAAYDAEVKIRTFLESSNYTLTLYKTAPDIQISYFLATNKQTETQVISVRGTSNIENAMVDILLKLRVDQNTGIQLHEGFAFAARQVYAELKPLIKADYKIRATGHSLGGAVALVVAMYLDADQFNIDQVITFGQPKVTNIAGANKISHINIIRVVTPLDIVPLVPPLDPLDINNLDVYWHAGKEVILLAENQYAVLAGLDSMLRATKFTQQPFNQRNIENHNMSVYLSMIGAKTKSSRLVPYKYDLNLFNLFGNE
ncbi:MAG: lipase family protein [Gammaproteobacteria bacterium]|nr:lipase family protein [Gammaproteobacteria bacterium]